VVIDNFIDPAKAKAIVTAYPSFDSAMDQGKAFSTINERKTIQISDASKYPEPVAELNALLASDSFLDDLSYITRIPKLLVDEQLVGGGISHDRSGRSPLMCMSTSITSRIESSIVDYQKRDLAPTLIRADSPQMSRIKRPVAAA
jgi:hypothetical protein